MIFSLKNQQFENETRLIMKGKPMDYLLFMVITVLMLVVGIGFTGYKVGVLVPIMIIIVIIVAILRVFYIKKKNSY